MVVIERGRAVGGLARTEVYKGFRFDIGGHRFFTKSEEIQRIWSEALGDDFLLRPRLSRIYYRGRFFHYPLQAWDALAGLGPLEAARAFASYLRRWAMPLPPEDTFEHWVVNRFGERLYETFFKSYTEKVWGVPCSELRAEWAAQRLKDLSLGAVLVRAMGLARQRRAQHDRGVPLPAPRPRNAVGSASRRSPRRRAPAFAWAPRSSASSGTATACAPS